LTHMSSFWNGGRALPREVRSAVFLGSLVFTATSYLACSGSDHSFGNSKSGLDGGNSDTGGASSSGSGGAGTGGKSSGGGVTGSGAVTGSGSVTGSGGASNSGGAHAGGGSGVPDASKDAADDSPTSNAH
jgi:hypothetical protein